MQSEEIKEKYSVSDVVAQVLAYSDLSKDKIEDVLSNATTLSINACAPLKAIKERILMAKENHEKILVVGDYDCDGICATAIMKDTLDRLGITCGYYIPHRFKEGYGINENIVNLAHEKGYKLIITVDNGVHAEAAIKRCNELNMTIIVSDHHTIQKNFPWDYLLHPTVMDSQFEALCGAGVALMISLSLLPEIKEHVILAAIATIGDMMPVFKENRIIIKRGIRYLNEYKMLPIELLLDRRVSNWDEKEIAFNIVPKLNAIGRMADQVNANNVVRYLLEDSLKELEAGAKQIKAINLKRKKLSKSYSDRVLMNLKEEKFHIIIEDDFHEGLIGLVANQVTSRTLKPSIVFCKKEDVYKGSARSTSSLSLFEFFQGFDEYLSEFGGHHLAAGIQVPVEKMEAFKKAVTDKIQNSIIKESTKQELNLEASACSIDALLQLERCKPFGQGFELPLFTIRSFNIKETQILKDRYPKWTLAHDFGELEAISFQIPKEEVREKILSFTGYLAINNYKGINKPTLQVIKLKKA